MKRYFTCDLWQKTYGYHKVIMFIDNKGYYIDKDGKRYESGATIEYILNKKFFKDDKMREITAAEVALIL